MKDTGNPSRSPPMALGETLTDAVLTVFRLNGALLQLGDALVEPLGLTSARWQMLGAIALAGKPLTAPQIGLAMGVTRQGAQKQLNLLLDQGLVETRHNPAHRRSPLYELTQGGRQLYTKAVTLWTAQASEIAARIPAAHLTIANRTLKIMLDQLSSLPDKEVSS